MGAPTISSGTTFRRCLPIFVTFLALNFITPTYSAEPVLKNEQLTFSVWNDSEKYVSSTSYNAKGMAPLYQSVNEVIKVFMDKDPIPEGYIEVKDEKLLLGPKVKDNDYSDLLKKYWGVLLVVAVAALIIVLMPIIGLCFCCCRCAGACGGRSQPFDKKHDTCRRVVLGILLICAATGLLFGVIVAFVTNSYMQEGVDNITSTVRHGMDDTKLYLDLTSSHINYLLTNNYDELSTNVEVTLSETSKVLIERLTNASDAISLENLAKFVDKLPTIKENLKEMKGITDELRVHASQLSDGLRGVKRDLLVQLTKCTATPCIDVLKKYEIGKLDANNIDYDQLPNLSDMIDSVQSLLTEDIVDTMKAAMNAFLNLGNQLNSTMRDNIRHVKSAMNKTGERIAQASNTITSNLNKISKQMVQYTAEGTKYADTYINEYSKYRFYFGIAVSCTLLLVLICLCFALFCGICGKRPDGYGDDCCNKGSGSRFLMLSVAIIFLTISILALAVLIHFLVGLVAQRGICVALRNPAHDEVFNYVNKLVDLNKFFEQNEYNNGLGNNKASKLRSNSPRALEPLTVSDVIVACKQNESIYEVLHLQNFFNIDEILNYPDSEMINVTLQQLIDSIKLDNKSIIPPGMIEKIKALAKSDLGNYDVAKFVDNVNDTITKYNLREIAEHLKETANKLANTPEYSDIRVSLHNQALHLETYQDKLVQPMLTNSKRILQLAKDLDNDLKFGDDGPFEDSIEKLLEQIKEAQTFIEQKGTEFVKSVAKELIAILITNINKYLHLVVNSIKNEVGYCAPMANVYDSLIVAGCNRIVDPFNGFWAGVGWCVLIFLPTLIISVKLSSLYQKSDPYPGPLVESEYLYDAYSERDNIPLANGPKNKRRKPKSRRRGSRDRRDYYDDSSSSHGVPSGRDTRYNDMAPKHWDGGPPRYQNPPMAPPASEYERPPPYYYPGAPSED